MLLKISVVQNWLADQATAHLSKELQTKVEIDQIEIQLFNKILLKGLYVEDLHRDTLLYAKNAVVYLDISEAIAGQIVIKETNLDGCYFQMQRFKGERQPSFHFLIEYFSKPSKKERKTRTNRFELALEHVYINDTKFRLYDEIAGTAIHAKLPKGELHANYSNLLSQVVFCDSVELQAPEVKIHLFPGHPMPPAPTSKSKKSKKQAVAWNLKAGKMRIYDMAFQLLNEKSSGPKPELPLDFNDLILSNTQLLADSLSFQNDSLTMALIQLSTKEQRGFELKQLKGDVLVSPRGAYVKNMNMRTPKSTIGHEIIFKYKSFADWSDFVHKVKMKAKVEGAKIAVSDIMTFAPTLYKNSFFITNKDKLVKGKFKFRGAVEDFSVRDLVLDVDNSHLEGELDLRPFDKYMYLKADQLNTNYKDVQSILAFTSIPKEISRLGDISFEGDFSGFFDNDFNTHGDLKTSLGRIHGDLQMNVHGGAQYAKYNGELSFDNFQLGYLLNQKDVGIFDAYTSIQGKGLTTESIDAAINDARVNTFEYKGYKYDTVTLSGILKPHYFEGAVKSKDPNFDLDLLGVADFREELPKVNLFGEIKQVHFQNLNLLSEELVLGIKTIKVDATGNKINNLEGHLNLQDIYFKRNWGEYHLQHLNINAYDRLLQNQTAVERVLEIESDIVNGVIQGQYDEVNLPKSLLNYAQTHYPNLIQNISYLLVGDSVNLALDSLVMPQNDSLALADSIPLQVVYMHLNIPDSKNLTESISKEFKAIKNGSLTINFNNKQNTLGFELKVDTIRWKKIEILGEHLSGLSNADTFKIENHLNQIVLNDTANLPSPYLALNALGDSLHYSLELSKIGDFASEISLNGDISFLERAIKTSLSNSGLVVLNQKWSVKGDNYMTFDFKEKVLDIHNLRLIDEFNEQAIILHSKGKKGLRVTIDNFVLDSLYKPVALPMFDVGGKLFATVLIEDIFAQKNLNANILLDQLVVNGDDWNSARLRLSADSLYAPIKGDFEHSGPWADFLKATVEFMPAFSTKKHSLKNKLEANISVKKARAHILEYFMVNQLSDTEGYVNASNVRIFGKLPKLHIRGDAQIHDVATTVNFLNVRYHLAPAHFKLRDNSLSFVPNLNILSEDNFINVKEENKSKFTPIQVSNEKRYYVNGGVKITDEQGNQGFISGQITHQYLSDWGIDLDIVMNNNLALNTTSESNMPFYGRVFATGVANFSGPFSKLKLSVEGRTNKEVSMGKPTSKKSVLVLPIMDPVEIKQAVDFLVFVDKKAESDSNSLLLEESKVVASGGLDVDMKINATPDAMARIIIDEKAGDVIEGSGNGDLHLTYSSAGEMDLRGLFVIKEGNYLFTYRNLLNKHFQVNDGGTIRWSGDPFDADINLSAKYRQKTALYNLLLSYQDELETGGLKELANQPVDVDVVMNMKGSLLKPDIKFGLDLNTTRNDRALSLAKLALRAIQQDESKLNRQVFGLIALQQFMPEEGAGVNVDLATTSVNTLSELITQQFSRHISDLLSEVVEDVDFISSVDFDLDYRLEEGQLSQGGSQLGFQLDQMFLQDRLRVSIGANVDFNNQGANSSQRNYIGGDFIIEYAITESGNLKMRAYSRSESDLFGPRIRSGAGIMYNREFDNFREFFKDIKKDIKERRKRYQARREKKSKQANNQNPS